MRIVIQCRSKVCNATINPNSTSIATVGGGGGDNQRSISSRKVSVDCCGLSKLLRKFISSKKESSGGGIRISTLLMRNNRKSRSRQSSFKCRYDPSSYSLNFDSSSSASNSLSSEEDDYYYQFCAFSSRFAAAVPRISTVSPSSTLTNVFS